MPVRNALQGFSATDPERWMLFRYFSQRYTRYAEVWPYEVTQLTEDLSSGRLVPSKGLTVWQITEMFSKFGFYPENYFREIHPNFDKLTDDPKRFTVHAIETENIVSYPCYVNNLCEV